MENTSLVSFLNDDEAKIIGELVEECADMLGSRQEVVQKIHQTCDQLIGSALKRTKDQGMGGLEHELTMAENRRLQLNISELEKQNRMLVDHIRKQDRNYSELHTKLMSKLNPC